MILISEKDDGHVGPAGSISVPDEYVQTINDALELLAREMHDWMPCNSEFESLPGGRSFSDLLDDDRIWINYDPTNDGKLWGWTIPADSPNDLVITKYALRMGYWSTAATIVHELAHLDGAPGGNSKAAEHTVGTCRMKSKVGPYDPNVVGSVVKIGGNRLA